MALTVERRLLSGSTNGKPIKCAASATPGTLIHTATTSTTPGSGGVWDEIWLYVTWDAFIGQPTATIEFGDATSPDHNIKFLPSNHMVNELVIPGLILQNGATVRIFASASTSGEICVSGFVNRITNA